jgi:hypothetical protein
MAFGGATGAPIENVSVVLLVLLKKSCCGPSLAGRFGVTVTL